MPESQIYEKNSTQGTSDIYTYDQACIYRIICKEQER